MYLEKILIEEYKTCPIPEKIDLLLTLRSIFNMMSESMEKIRKKRELDRFEEDVLNLELFNLRNDIWICENEINKIRKQTTDKDILEKVEAAQIDNILRKIAKQEPAHADITESIQRLLLQISLYCLQIKALNNRNQKSSISEKEKNILSEIIESLKLKIRDNYHEIDYKKCWVISTDFRYRREIIDKIEDSQIEASEFLPSQSCITVDYLKKEAGGNPDLRKWDNKDWLHKRYDKFRAPIHPFLDNNYMFNFQALKNGLDRYSFKKQIGVNLGCYSACKIQLEALIKWRKTREKITEYEELIYNYKTTKHQKSLDILDLEIIKIFYVDILKSHYYSPEEIKKIRTKIDEANLNIKSYEEEEIGKKVALKREESSQAKYNELLINCENLEFEYNKKHNQLSFSFAPGHMSNNAYINPSDIHDPDRAEYIKFLITEHNIQTVECDALLECDKSLKHLRELKRYEKRYERIIIESLCAYKTHCVLLTDEKIWNAYNMLPNDYPDRREILKEIKMANVCLDIEEIEKEEQPDRDLHNYSDYPGSKELFVDDEPPKPIKCSKKKGPKPEDSSTSES